MKIVRTLSALSMITVVCVLIACRAVPSPLEDYEWVLTSYTTAGENKAVLPDIEVTVFFDSEENQLSGNGGCNSYGGSYEVDGMDISVTGPLYRTEMWCGDEIGEQENMYLDALQSAGSYQIEHGSLIIDCGKWILYFSRK